MKASNYFYRNTIFSKIGDKISIVDLYNPDKNRQELEPWLGMILQLADGQHTIKDAYDYLAKGYKGDPPENLELTIHSVVERLVEAKFVKLADTKTELPYYLAFPYEALDVVKAKRLLSEDYARGL